MEENLEGGKPKLERAKTTLGTEELEPTSQEEKPTLGKQISEEEFRRSQVSWDKQITLHKAEAEKAKARSAQLEAEQKYSEAYIQSLKEEMDKLSADDPEVRKSYTSRMASLEREMKLAKREAEVASKVAETEKKEHDLAMALRAKHLIEETGVPLEEIESCQSEAEMEIKALRYKLNSSETRSPKFDTGISSGGSIEGIPTDITKFRQWITTIPQEEYEKKYASKVNELRRQGKIK